MIKKAQTDYKDEVEEKLKTGNANDAWRGLNKVMGRQQKPAAVQCDEALILSNELNVFYSRFDKRDFKDECDSVSAGLTPCPVNLQ